MKPYLTYYKKNKIIPVIKVNNKNTKILDKQRSNLFDQLKIDKRLFYNSEVLEVGPGTGYNANYLINCGVKKITLVDGNKSSIESVKKTLKKKKSTQYKILQNDFLDLKLKKKFDFVICENVISGVKNPEKFLRKLSSLVSDNGYLLINCSDNISLFSEKIRGVIAYLLIDVNKLNNSSFKIKTKFLSKIFASHLKSLGRNTRAIDDWVQDVLLYEYWWRKKSYFSLYSAINTVKDKFNFYSSSPFCFTSYSWYKNTKFSLNDHTLNEFFKIQQNFFDIRSKNIYFSKKENKNFNNLVNKASKCIYSLKYENLNNLLSILYKFKKFVSKYEKNNLTVNSLNQVIVILSDYKKRKKIDIRKIEKLKSWWGYATQYIVFKKK